jgi:hypothetical protein
MPPAECQYPSKGSGTGGGGPCSENQGRRTGSSTCGSTTSRGSRRSRAPVILQRARRRPQSLRAGRGSGTVTGRTLHLPARCSDPVAIHDESQDQGHRSQSLGSGQVKYCAQSSVNIVNVVTQTYDLFSSFELIHSRKALCVPSA